jgi:hypothetical protein
MAHHYLLPTQQNDVFRAIEDAGLNPADFHWETVQSEIGAFRESVPVLVYTSAGAAFIFDFDKEQGEHWALYVPGVQKPSEKVRTVDWGAELIHVTIWLQNLKEQFFTPNLWDELGRERQLVQATEPDAEENSAFTLEEQAQIAIRLDEVREVLIGTDNLEGDRLRAIETRLDYLKEASTRMGRRDWLNIFYGSVFSWALTSLISPTAAREVIFAVAHGIGHFFGGGLPQLPGP